MRSFVSDLNGLRRGHVSIVAAQATSTDFLPHAIAELKNRFPRVSFDCDFTGTANVIPRLIDGTADIGVAFQSSSDRRVRNVISVPLPFGVIVHVDHHLAKKSAVRLGDFENELVIPPDHSIFLPNGPGSNDRRKILSVSQYRYILRTNLHSVAGSIRCGNCLWYAGRRRKGIERRKFSFCPAPRSTPEITCAYRHGRGGSGVVSAGKRGCRKISKRCSLASQALCAGNLRSPSPMACARCLSLPMRGAAGFAM